jgi:hypothetical protein
MIMFTIPSSPYKEKPFLSLDFYLVHVYKESLKAWA